MPAHVARFGPQVKAKGVNPGNKDVDRTIGHITKYATKAAADCHTITSDAQRDHLHRLWHALRVTPCPDRCANWLLYGIQPKHAHGKLRPGHCQGRVHQQATLGIGGRRILVSRDWFGKTPKDYKYDTKAWVRALLGISTDHEHAPPAGTDNHGDQAEPGTVGVQATDPGYADAQATDPANTPTPTVAWEFARHDDPDLAPLGHRLLRTISQRIQWRAQLNAARQRPPNKPPGDRSATDNHTLSREENLR